MSIVLLSFLVNFNLLFLVAFKLRNRDVEGPINEFGLDKFTKQERILLYFNHDNCVVLSYYVCYLSAFGGNGTLRSRWSALRSKI
jgi:hypothetical protein